MEEEYSPRWTPDFWACLDFDVLAIQDQVHGQLTKALFLFFGGYWRAKLGKWGD